MERENKLNCKQMADEVKQYTLKELKVKLTEKEKAFCHYYIIDWNGAKSARLAGYSENTCAVIACENLIKPYIEQYINFIKNDFEKESGLSKLKVLNELHKIAFSSIANLHNTWIELHDFNDLTDDQKASIESIETKVLKKNIGGYEVPEIVDVEYVKIKLFSKNQAIDSISKMLGYNSPEKTEISGLPTFADLFKKPE
jgi:phage terminase small subunit